MLNHRKPKMGLWLLRVESGMQQNVPLVLKQGLTGVIEIIMPAP